MKKSVVAVLAVFGLALAGPVAAQGDSAAVPEKSMICAACHGFDGNSFNPEWPSHAGQHESYLIKQLQDFRAGKRDDPLMSAQAMGLTDEEILELAAYYASLPANPMGAADPEQVKLGAAVYRGGNLASGVAACSACHGPEGNGNAPAKFPSLTGQHAAYTAKQIRAFRDGTRANDLNGMMGMVASRMTDAEIEAVAQFIQGLRNE